MGVGAREPLTKLCKIKLMKYILQSWEAVGGEAPVFFINSLKSTDLFSIFSVFFFVFFFPALLLLFIIAVVLSGIFSQKSQPPPKTYVRQRY